jgi:hypothetical protein
MSGNDWKQMLNQRVLITWQIYAFYMGERLLIGEYILEVFMIKNI